MVRQKNRRIQSRSGLVGSFDEARSQLGILSGPHDLKGLGFDSIFQTRSSDTSRNSGRFFFQCQTSNEARQTMLFKGLEESFIYGVHQFMCR